MLLTSLYGKEKWKLLRQGRSVRSEEKRTIPAEDVSAGIGMFLSCLGL
jgi:hypothetical protein